MAHKQYSNRKFILIQLFIYSKHIRVAPLGYPLSLKSMIVHLASKLTLWSIFYLHMVYSTLCYDLSKIVSTFDRFAKNKDYHVYQYK
jgi:hypothetical protein